MSIRVGIDLVRVDDVRDAVAAHGDRYLTRVFTARELSDAAGDPERLAARFAAKEAAFKVLRPTADDALPWQSIEVVRRDGGWTELEIHGRAQQLAGDAGIDELAVSLTHDGDRASAVVVASTSAGEYR